MTLRKPNRRKFLRTSAAAGAATTFGAPLIAKGAPEYKVKMATLAPEGSYWAREFDRNRKRIDELTDGRLKLQVYPGGVMGDEPAMIRKVRTGQLDGAAVTSVGLGQIDKQLLVMQLPLLFKNYKQLDYVREKMKPTFDKLYEDAGFIRSINGDVGELYLFTNSPVKKPSDLRGQKVWSWSADPTSKAVLEAAKVNGVELDVPDVLPGLQTGLINAFVSSPYASIALQWYSKAAYVTNLKLAMGIGASVMSLKTWNSLPDDIKEVLNKVAAESEPRLLKRIRRGNAKAVKTLQKKGISVVEPDDIMAWTSVAMAVRKKLTGKLFPQSLLDELDGHIKASG